MCGNMSDTLKFQSSTSTVRDYQTAQKLAQLQVLILMSLPPNVWRNGRKLNSRKYSIRIKAILLHGYEIGVSQVTVYEHEKYENKVGSD